MAEKEPMSTVTMAGKTFEIVDKIARERIPTKVSQLENDAGYKTKCEITSTDDGAGNVTIIEGTSSGGEVTSITSYMSLRDKPTLEGVTIAGDKSLEDFNLKTISNTDLEKMLKED